MIKITFIDFFAGVGGFRKGLELAGHKCLGFCEYDKYAVQSYRAIHETEGEWYARDIREVRAVDIPRADMWCAGFPCQDVSICGKQLGFKGKRSSLFFTVTSLVADLKEKDRPSMLFFENVKNLLSVNRGFDFARLLIELDKIGYDAQWSLINSADVVPQNRERVFIIANIRKRDRPKVFPIGEGDGESNWAGTFVKQIAQLYGTENEPNPQAGRVYSSNGICPTLDTCQGGNRMPKIAISMTQKTFHKIDVANTLTAAGPSRGRGNSSPVNGVAIFQRPHGNNKGGVHNIAPTLTSNCYEHNNVVLDTICNKSDIQIRKLTPLECWRLQGWSDEDFFKAFFLDKELGIRFNRIYQKHKQNPVRLMQWAFKHQKMSDSQLYKQAGNGVTVKVIQRIGERI